MAGVDFRPRAWRPWGPAGLIRLRICTRRRPTPARSSCPAAARFRMPDASCAQVTHRATRIGHPAPDSHKALIDVGFAFPPGSEANASIRCSRAGHRISRFTPARAAVSGRQNERTADSEPERKVEIRALLLSCEGFARCDYGTLSAATICRPMAAHENAWRRAGRPGRCQRRSFHDEPDGGSRPGRRGRGRRAAGRSNRRC
mgnify:CR=1 FL=1